MNTNENHLKKIVSELPDSPGVYRYYDKKRNLLYIGKAKSLKKRVSSYFQDSKAHNERTTLMVSLIDHIEYTKVKTEKEALILEANLINNLQPKYNIALKDDKSYVYIEYTKKDPIPGFFVVRRKENKDSDYYGPYTNTRQINDVMKVLRTVFPFCQERVPQKKKCFYCSIKQCNGICTQDEILDTYLERNLQLLNVLNGKTKKAQEEITFKIQEFIKNSNFESAGYYRDRLVLLKDISEKQKIVLKNPQDIDLINLVYQTSLEGDITGSFFVQQIRDGKIINVFNSILSGTVTDGGYMDLLNNFMFNYTTKNGYQVPPVFTVSEYRAE
ncbi:MAG: GIY-YIG nuclease family protein [Patescibacteria group bacterium]